MGKTGGTSTLLLGVILTQLIIWIPGGHLVPLAETFPTWARLGPKTSPPCATGPEPKENATNLVSKTSGVLAGQGLDPSISHINGVCMVG